MAKTAKRGFARKDMDSAANKRQFLTELAERCHVEASARAIGVSKQRVYEWAKKDEKFKAAWAEVRTTLVADAFEDEAVRRGVHGVDEPVFYQGEPTGQWVDPEGRLLRRTSESTWVHVTNGKAADPDGVRFRPNVIRKYSDTLLAMMLNGAKPEKYRQRHEHSGSVHVTFTREDEGVL